MQRNVFIIAGAILVAVAVGVLVYLSGNDGLESITTSQPSAVAVPFTVVDHGIQSGVEKRANYFITSAEGLDDFWDMAEISTPKPEVDFSKQMLLAVFAGTRSSGGYDIKVKDVVENEDTRTVVVEIVEPGSGCANTAALTNPYEIVAVPVSMTDLAHQDEIKKVSCSR